MRYEKRTKEYATRFAAAGLRDLTVKEETIDDALSAAAQLRTTESIDPKRIFVLGHSLGGLVAPRIGQADPKLAGLIILAGSTRPLEDLMVEQTRYLLSLRGEPTAEEQAKINELVTNAATAWIIASDSESSELVASSRMRMRGSASSARAMESRWRWPPESFTPRSPTMVS